MCIRVDNVFVHLWKIAAILTFTNWVCSQFWFMPRPLRWDKERRRFFANYLKMIQILSCFHHFCLHILRLKDLNKTWRIKILCNLNLSWFFSLEWPALTLNNFPALFMRILITKTAVNVLILKVGITISSASSLKNTFNDFCTSRRVIPIVTMGT